MRQEIEKTLADINIANKRFRRTLTKATTEYGAGFFSLLIPIIILSIFTPETAPVMVLLGMIPIFILGFYFAVGLYEYINPYSREEIAFKKIADAISILEKSKDPMAYDEAYLCLKKGLRVLKGTPLSRLRWYNGTTKTLEEFFDNFELIVLPMTSKAKIKEEHLEKMSLAVYSQKPSAIEEVNKELEMEPSYKKEERPLKRRENPFGAFTESKIGRVVVSLSLGYGLIFVICVVFVLATDQNLLVFAKEHPEIIVLGGLGATGITFWRTRQSE
jgi:hypothetical protein